MEERWIFWDPNPSFQTLARKGLSIRTFEGGPKRLGTFEEGKREEGEKGDEILSFSYD